MGARGDMSDSDYVGNQGAKLLLKWRESKKINQSQAARALDVERFTYKKWETGLGLPSVPKAVMLEDKCGIPFRTWTMVTGSEVS